MIENNDSQQLTTSQVTMTHLTDLKPVHRHIPSEILSLIAESCIEIFTVEIKQDTSVEPPMTKAFGIPAAAELAVVNRDFLDGIRMGLKKGFDGKAVVANDLVLNAFLGEAEFPDCQNLDHWLRVNIKEVTFEVDGSWARDGDLAAAVYHCWLGVFYRVETVILWSKERIFCTLTGAGITIDVNRPAKKHLYAFTCVRAERGNLAEFPQIILHMQDEMTGLFVKADLKH